MSVVYSLYDALVSIKVPDDKAKAVIDAMEREMMDKLVTKADLATLRAGVSGEFVGVTAEFKLVRQEMAPSRKACPGTCRLLRRAWLTRWTFLAPNSRFPSAD